MLSNTTSISQKWGKKSKKVQRIMFTPAIFAAEEASAHNI
jgi:hypothetical protein